MVHTLIRLRLAIMRHKYRGPSGSLAIWGIMLGLTAAGITWFAGLSTFDNPALHSDVMVLVFGVWTAGWAFGPTLFGSEDTTLRPEHYRYLPISTNRLAAGLLGASVVSISVVVSFLAFTSLIAYASRLGTVAILISFPALLLQLTFAVTLSRFATSALRRLTRSQLSVLISSAIMGIVQAFLVTGWALFAIDFTDLSDGFPPIVSTLTHASPSGWGVVAIDAAADGRWLLSVVTLTGLAGGAVLCTGLWARLLHLRMTTTPERTSSTRSFRWLVERIPATPSGSVIRKEFLSWIRDYTRSGQIYFAFFYAVAICLFPLAAGVSEALPWAGALFVLTTVGATSNVYGYDGSSLWLTLTTPDAIRHDVRGRQIAWLILVAPVAIILTVGLTLISRQMELLLPALTAVIAGLGVSAGILIASSVFWLISTTDPNRREGEPADEGTDPGKFLVILITAALLAAPPVGISVYGYIQGERLLQILGLIAGIGFGLASWWLFGRLAIWRLESTGPDLLNLMIKGPPQTAPSAEEKEASRWVGVYVTIGIIALIPQSLVPIVFTLAGEDVQVWFVAMFLSGIWRWLAIFGFGVIGVMFLYLTVRKSREHQEHD